MKSRNSQETLVKGNTILSAGIAAVVALASIGLLYLATNIVNAGGPYGGRMGMLRVQTFLNESILLTTVTMLLLLVLLTQYIQTYLELKSEFTLGLIILVVALFLNSVSANPLFFTQLGYGPMVGPFSFIPSLFSLVAAVVLIYLNNK